MSAVPVFFRAWWGSGDLVASVMLEKLPVLLLIIPSRYTVIL